MNQEQNEVETVYGARLRDQLPFQDNLTKFVNAALEKGETQVDLNLEAESGFYDANDSKTRYTIEATADTIGYRDHRKSIPSIRDASTFRKILETLGDRIENLSDKEIDYEINSINHENAVSLY